MPKNEDNMLNLKMLIIGMIERKNNDLHFEPVFNTWELFKCSSVS